MIEESKFTGDSPRQSFTEGKDWIILVEKIENRPEKLLTRRIITLRKVGEYYRREEEIHQVRVYNTEDIVNQLEQIGFKVELRDNYGDFFLPQGNKAIVARKLT